MGTTVWAILRVKDEIDVISSVLNHLATENFDGILIADNNSSDGTMHVLDEFHDTCHASSSPLDWRPFVAIFEDHDVGYYQAEKMTALADMARSAYKADWVVPVDADEIWFAHGQPLGDYLRSLPGQVDSVRARLFNHFPTSSDSQISDPITRITRRDPDPAPLPKVAIRWRSGMKIHQGNHGVDGSVNQIDGELEIRHFPWRTFRQFAKKVRNGARAYAATDLPEEMGGHWRGYGRVLEEHGEAALRSEIWDRWFFDPPLDLVEDPAPYMRWKR